MNASRRCLCAFVITLTLSPLPQTAFAQDSRQQVEARAWAVETLRYYNLADKATSQEIEKIAELKSQILTPTLNFRDRLSACTEAYSVFLRLMGGGSVPQQTIIQTCVPPTQAAHARLTNADYKPFNRTTSPPGELSHVEKMGRGPIPVILIPDYGTDWTLYRTFMERNRDRYTMYAVTLPGFGDTPVPPKPKFYDPKATPWWNSAEQGVVKLIRSNKLNRPFVIGTQAGAYLAARLALDHPNIIRGVVLLNGLVKMPLPVRDNPNVPLGLKERHQMISGRPDLTGLMWEFPPLVVLTPSAAEKTISQVPPPVQQLFLGLNTRDPERGKALYIDFLTKTDPRAFTYFIELNSTDLTDDLKYLKVPMLVIPSLHDEKSPALNNPAMPGPNNLALSQWNEIKQSYLSIPLAIVPFENTRNYATEEAPLELDRAIAAFVAGKPVEVKR